MPSFSNWLTSLRRRHERRVLVLGLSDDLTGGVLRSVVACGGGGAGPAAGAGVGAVRLHRARVDRRVLVLWEVGGSDEMRVFWPHHYAGAQAVLFVADGRLPLARALAELEDVAAHPLLAGVPVAVVGVGGAVGWKRGGAAAGRVKEWVLPPEGGSGAAGDGLGAEVRDLARWLAEEARV